MADLNWDDLRYLLAVLEGGSLGAAATKLAVTRATVSRRMSQLEEALGVQLFERLPTGLVVTSAGASLREPAEAMAARVHEMQRCVEAPKLAGPLTVSAPEGLLTSWLMPHLGAFADAYPAIELELVGSDALLDLNRREADVVIRVTNDPPDTLVGRRVLRVAYALYVARERAEELTGDGARWLGWLDRSGEAEWTAGAHAGAPVRHRVGSAMLALEAARRGLGLARLGCHLADGDPTLVRVPPGEAFFERWVWLLTHPGLRHGPRVRAFCDFMYPRMTADRSSFEADASRWRAPPVHASA